MITKKRKRSPSSGTKTSKPVLVRLQPALLAALDAWCAEQLTRPSRPEAIRRLVEAGLKRK
jgi:hypothetical protein